MFWLKFCVETRLSYEPLEPFWFSSISGAKIMSQKPKSGQNFYPHKRKPGLNNTHFVYGPEPD